MKDLKTRLLSLVAGTMLSATLAVPAVSADMNDSGDRYDHDSSAAKDRKVVPPEANQGVQNQRRAGDAPLEDEHHGDAGDQHFHEFVPNGH